jgi:GTPase SAR1 family protein
MAGRPEVRIALFGMKGAGKTTLLASYFGNQQRNAFEERHGYRLEAADAAQGSLLLSRYYRLEGGDFPIGTDGFDSLRFGMKVHELPTPSLDVVWYDYPGGWWETAPSDEAERSARREALKHLLDSHAAILLVDSERYAREGITYARTLLDQFRAEIRRVTNELSALGQAPDFPDQWLIAFSKADLLGENATALTLAEQLREGAADQLTGVQKAVGGKSSFGQEYLLLSAVRGDGRRVLDAHQSLGLTAIAPVVLLGALARVAEEIGRGRVWGTLATTLEVLRSLTEVVDKLDDFLPPKYRVLTVLLKALRTKEGLTVSAEKLRHKQSAAARRGKALDAAAYALRAELASPETARAYFKTRLASDG